MFYSIVKTIPVKAIPSFWNSHDIFLIFLSYIPRFCFLTKLHGLNQPKTSAHVKMRPQFIFVHFAPFVHFALSATLFFACTAHSSEITNASFIHTCQAEASPDACEQIDATPSDAQAFQWFETPEHDIAIRRGHADQWSFTPGFVFENTPDAALERALQAIKTNDADAFCSDFDAPQTCVRLFHNHQDNLHEAYVQPARVPQWTKTRDNYYVTLAHITFIFAPKTATSSKWRLVSLCAFPDAQLPDFAPCK